jgi:phytoene dehydrogenase-like protein
MTAGATERSEVVVVGAGLAGLACAADLVAAGREVLLLEASDGPGGRVRTDEVDGFRMDRGFQVLLAAYPEVQRRVDVEALALGSFYPGALVRVEGAFHRLADPGLEMADALRAVNAPVGSLADKLRVARLRQQVMGGPPDRLLEAPAGTTLATLEEAGFSGQMIDRFFRPFFGGVLLDPELGVSGKLFRYYFRMFAEGLSAVPAGGMEALPRELARGLPEGTLRTGARVRSVTARTVELESGGRIEAEAVVLAVEGPEAARLAGGEVVDPGSRGVTCFWFAAPESPVDEGILVLNGEGPSAGPVNNLAVLSDVAPGYAPPGRSLVAATVLGNPRQEEDPGALEARVRAHLAQWYGGVVEGWETLHVNRIHHAQPLQPPEALDPPRRPVRLASGLFVGGDHRENASLNGALASGGRVAQAVLQALA